MTRFCTACIAALCLLACQSEVIETSTTLQAGSNLQGTELDGLVLHGNAAGKEMRGFQLSGATLNGNPLVNLRLEQGELVAEQNQVTLHDDDLEDAHLYAEVRNLSTNPVTTITVEYRITDVVAEDTDNDPTGTGETFLYTLEENVNGSGNWQPACNQDADSQRVAIPVAGVWDQTGARSSSSTLFTFGCTTGVIAKCYRWGYRPWVTGYGDLTTTHQVCTRAARADYCGNGSSHTHEGTSINIWDTLGSPGPIQSQGSTPSGMVFEAGWNTNGAVCLSHNRWLLGGPLILLGCPGKLIAPGLLILGATVCDTVNEVLGLAPSAKIFNESNLNVNLGDL
jgi:ADYC domain